MSKLYKAETDKVERWQLPQVDTDTEAEGPYSRLITAEQIEKIQKEAYEEGFRQGYMDGTAAGENHISEQLRYLKTIISVLNEPVEYMDEFVVKQLLELCMIISGQIIRRELHMDPGQVIAVVRECIKSLPAGARNIQLFLHPDDASLVRDAFSIDEMKKQAWSIKEDPVLTRGGCRVETQNSIIDASVEQQLKRIIATLLGGEREEDANDSQ